MGWLVLLFTVVPLVDLWLLLLVGDVFGFWPTVAMTVLVAIVGGYLGKREGGRVLSAWRRALAELRMPEDGLVSGLLVVVGAAMLVAPGLITDAVGLLLLIPPTRRIAARWVQARVSRRLERARAEGHVGVHVASFAGARIDDADDLGDPHDIHVPDVVDTEGEAVVEVEAASEAERVAKPALLLGPARK